MPFSGRLFFWIIASTFTLLSVLQNLLWEVLIWVSHGRSVKVPWMWSKMSLVKPKTFSLHKWRYPPVCSGANYSFASRHAILFLSDLHQTSDWKSIQDNSNCLFSWESWEIPIGSICVNYQVWKIFHKSFYWPLSWNVTLHSKETQISYFLYSFQNCSPLACVRFEGSSGSVRSWEGCIVLNKMRAVLQNPVPCYTGSIYTEGKKNK